MSRLTPQAAVITHKTTVDGSCGKDRLPIASWTATGYVLEGTQWKAVFRAGSAVVDPAKLPKRTLDATAGDRPVSYDANTEGMLGREQAIWDAWKDRDAKRLDALMPQEVQFIDIFGTHIGTRGESIMPGPGGAATSRASSLPMPGLQCSLRILESSPCMPPWTEAVLVNPSSRSGHHRSTSGTETPGSGASASTFRRTEVRSDSGWSRRGNAQRLLTLTAVRGARDRHNGFGCTHIRPPQSRKVPMDADELKDFGRRYAAAWCSRSPAGVAGFTRKRAPFKLTAGRRRRAVWLSQRQCNPS